MSSVAEKRTGTAAKAAASSTPSKKSKASAAASSSSGAAEEEKSANGKHVNANDAFILKMMKTPASEIMVNPARSVSISGVLHCSKDDVLPDVLKTLDQQRILSMPVCVRRDNIFTGFIEIQDIVAYIAKHFANRKLTTYEQFEKMWNSIDSFNVTTVDDIWNDVKLNSKAGSPHSLPAGYSLYAAFEMLAKSGYHRICVTNDKHQIVTILTQSMMIDYAKAHIDLFADEIRERRVSLLTGLHAGAPILVKDSDRMIRAFQLMSEHNVSGVGVVDSRGRLVDVVSARDLRGTPLNAVSYYGLYSTVREWKDSVKANVKNAPKAVVIVRNDDSLEHLINEMAVHKVHRVFVVDDDMKPQKCVAQTDALRNLLLTAVPVEA